MKKLLAILFICAAFLSCSCVPVLAANHIRVVVSGKQLALDVPPKIESGHVLVPVRFIVEELGAKIEKWDPATGTIQITYGGSKIGLTVGLKAVRINQDTLRLEIAPQIIKGRTLVPLRFVSEAMGANAKYQPDISTVIINGPGPEKGKFDTSLYYFRKYNPEKEISEDGVVWTEGDLSIFAKKSKSKEKYISDTVISSLIIEKGNKKYVIELIEKPMYISSLALSACNEYLAAYMFYHYGYKLIVINLNNGEYFILNNYLECNGKGFVETIHSYNWSPDGNKLAFSFGDTSKSRLAIYDLDHKTFSLIPTETDFITTAYILWHKDGKGLDFISEYPSNHYKLYRYYFDRDHVEKIGDVDRDDFVLKLKGLFKPT